MIKKNILCQYCSTCNNNSTSSTGVSICVGMGKGGYLNRYGSNSQWVSMMINNKLKCTSMDNDNDNDNENDNENKHMDEY